QSAPAFKENVDAGELSGRGDILPNALTDFRDIEGVVMYDSPDPDHVLVFYCFMPVVGGNKVKALVLHKREAIDDGMVYRVREGGHHTESETFTGKSAGGGPIVFNVIRMLVCSQFSTRLLTI